MPKESEAKAPAPAAAPAPTAEQLADEVIEQSGGPRAAVVALLEIVRHLEADNRALRAAASPGFARVGPAPGRSGRLV